MKKVIILLALLFLAACTQQPICGDGIADPSETSDTCCDDVGCPEGQVCKYNLCFTPECGECQIYQDGCVDLACCSDEDCDDSNPDTDDSCINPGEISAECHYETCEDLCEAGQTECSGKGYRECGNFDSDTCLEWSEVIACATGCQDGACLKTDTVFIGIDQNNYDLLTLKVTRFLDDLQAEGYETELKSYDDPTAEEVRNDIIKTYEKSELVGVILIGDMPYKNVTDSGGEYPSDVFYLDINNKCEYLEGELVHSSLLNKCFFSKSNQYNDFWIGRIMPPISGSEGTTLLEAYFDRNHDYRTGKKVYNDKMLAYIEILEDPSYTNKNVEAELLDSVETGELFRKRDVTVIAPEIAIGYEDCRYDRDYKNGLSLSYKYVFLNAKGSATFHRCNINASDIISLKPQAMFYEIRSNSGGDFSKANYMAGWYIFSGAGLVTDVYPSGDTVNTFFHKGLARGMTVGDAKILLGSGTTIFGDPSLTFERKVITKAQLSLNVTEINFGEIQKCDYQDNVNMYEHCVRQPVTFTITNTGQEILEFRPLVKFKYTKPVPSNPDRLYVGSVLTDTTTLVPYQSTTAKAYFLPPDQGDFNGMFVFLSNSEKNPVLELPFTATGVR